MSRQWLLIATVVIAAAGIVFWLAPWGVEEPGETNGADSAASAEGAFRPPESREVTVTAATAHRADLVMSITAAGTAEADRLLEISSQVSGRIKEIPIVEGQFVDEGELLVLLDDTELRMDRDQAEAALLQSVMRFAENMMAIPGDPVIRESDLNQVSGMSAAEFLRQFISTQGYQALRAHPNL